MRRIAVAALIGSLGLLGCREVTDGINEASRKCGAVGVRKVSVYNHDRQVSVLCRDGRVYTADGR